MNGMREKEKKQRINQRNTDRQKQVIKQGDT